ncbi:hypothetical protein PR202_gb26874 [Eleusine coracana subsp. coracana]|uniref:Uncharacterized protein n=1 Tax=Eleusine coracana subsp. coracana TaxID=191504 RepID=A0AAV5FSB7_ELECO|nr:hypothetical protein PR202_gb26874 [Eleusine coracana subsp. coracana]
MLTVVWIGRVKPLRLAAVASSRPQPWRFRAPHLQIVYRWREILLLHVGNSPPALGSRSRCRLRAIVLHHLAPRSGPASLRGTTPPRFFILRFRCCASCSGADLLLLLRALPRLLVEQAKTEGASAVRKFVHHETRFRRPPRRNPSLVAKVAPFLRISYC